MATHKFKSIANIVEEVVNKHLPEGDIRAVSKQLERIKHCWPQCVGERLAQNVIPVRLIDSELLLETHSPVWANKMRYLRGRTLENLGKLGFGEIDSLTIKVNPRRAELNRHFNP